MSGVKEIKERMNSIRDTQKITNAMYMISSTKLQKAKRELEQTKPYFDALRGEISRIFASTEEIESRYFFPNIVTEYDPEDVGILLITADKGLAGAYNQNLIKKAEELIQQYENTRLFVVGEYGRQYFTRKKVPIEHSFLYTAQNPTVQRARDISAMLLDQYDQNKLDIIYVVYADMRNSMSEEVYAARLLPFHRSHFLTEQEQNELTGDYDYYGEKGELLDNIMYSYVTGYIYSALISSFCSEQNARMTAMSSANENAEKIMEVLKKEYNHVRQSLITQEITEVAAGARAQKKKRMREVSK